VTSCACPSIPRRIKPAQPKYQFALALLALNVLLRD
jgi:hypothetical protein